MGTDEDRRRIVKLLRNEAVGWRKERLIALKMGFCAEHTVAEISAVVGRSVPTVQRWFDRYRRDGLEALLKRGHKGGVPTRRSAQIEAFLAQGLEVGRWNTAVQAQQDLERHVGRSFRYQTVWYWLKKCAGVLRVPRPVHEKRDPAQAEAFKRRFLGILKGLPIPSRKPVKVWFADESRYGLLPVQRRLWTRKGLRPHKRWQTRYEWSYCYGALDVVDGKTVFLQTPSANLAWTEAFLKEIKKMYPDFAHVVVWDGAGFHPKDSNHPQVPDGIHIVPLPPYSPELNPIEKLWDCLQDYTANKLWPSIERLDKVVALLLKDWWEDPRKVLRLVGNHYHRASANASANTNSIILD